MNYNQFELPNQNLPESAWTKKYYLEHANKMIQYVGNDTFTELNEKIAKCYRRYSCELSPKEKELNTTITKQYGYEIGVEYMIYPLAEMIVDQLVSEYISVSMRKKLYSINKDAINEKLDKKVRFISEEIFRKENEKMQNELGFVPETENPEIDLPDDIELFFSKSYKTLAEELGDDIVEQFLEVLKEKRKVKTLIQDYLIGERVIASIDEKDGHPTIVRSKYDECYIDINPDEEIQTDINIFATFPFMTKNEILNKYDLNKEDREKLDGIFTKMSNGLLLDAPFSFNASVADTKGYQNCPQGVSYNNWADKNSKNRIRVLRMKWRSRREIRAIVHTDKYTGEEIFKILKPDEKERKRDNVRTATIETVRELEMVGPEMLLSFGESKERITFMDNKKKVLLPVVALIGRNTMYSDEIRSVVAKIAPLQKMASDILFELRLAIKANNGRVLVYDTAQIPKQFLDTYGHKNAINRMLHHIKKDKILLFNSKDKIGSKATFNQFTALDLSNRGQTQDLINAIMLIEDLARKFVGLSKERQGEVGQYQTAQGTDRAVMGSNARTEVYFNPFDEFYQALLGTMLMKSKHIYKKGQVFSYVFGDLKAKFLTMFQEYFNSDLGIYFADRFKNKRDKELIDAAAQQALGNTSDKELLLDLINVLQSESASESKAILEKGLTAFAKLQAENAKSAQAAEEAKMKHEMEKEDRLDARDQAKNQNNIDVANIYADNKTFNENEKRTTEELIAAAKIAQDSAKEEKAEAAKQKTSK